VFKVETIEQLYQNFGPSYIVHRVLYHSPSYSAESSQLVQARSLSF
jgi:hypothetical protein